VSFCRTRSLKDVDTLFCRPGDEVKATKDGDWLIDQQTGLLLPFTDKSGTRNFKNARLLLMEKAAKDTDEIPRTVSKNSQSSQGSISSGRLSRGNSSILRRQSFRWVDMDGTSHRLAGDSDVLKDVKQRPEVWICVKPGGVQFRRTPLLDAVSGQECVCGAKVTAVKEDDWLKVLEVKTSWDMMDAAEALGRRSLRSPTKVTIVDTGLFLPFVQEGERLFKNEKLVLFEQTEGYKPPATKNDGNGSCSLM